MANTPEKTVFIVDDDEGVRTSLGILLDSTGYAPVPFASASEFLAQYDANRPGCLVLDIRMPDMNCRRNWPTAAHFCR